MVLFVKLSCSFSAQKDANGDANARPDGHVSVAMNGTTHKADDPDDKPLEDVQL